MTGQAFIAVEAYHVICGGSQGISKLAREEP